MEHQHGRRFIVLEHQYGRRDVMWKHSIGIQSLSNDDSDVNENGKKAIGFNQQNNNSARVSRFFVHFFAVIARFVAKVNTRRRLSFSFPDLR